MDSNLLAVVALIAVALVFDFINGFHDAANSIATVVSTRVLTPGKAVIWAAFFNFIAAFTFGTAVAKTVGAGLVDISIVSFSVIFAGLMGAIIWDLITWYYGLPTSSSHALIGGYAGAAVTKAGWGAIIVSGWTKTLIFIVLAPLIGMILGFLLMVAILWIFSGFSPGRVDQWFRKLQLLSAAAYSLGHGGNDAQKTMGIIAGALVAGGYLGLEDGHLPIPHMGRAHRARGDRARHALGRLAHHPHDGIEDHQADARGRFRRRDGWRHLALHRDAPRRPRQHDAYDHRRDHRRRIDPAAVGRPLGRGRPDCVGLDPDDSRLSVHRRGHLLADGSDDRTLTNQAQGSGLKAQAKPSTQLTRRSCLSPKP